MIYVLIAGSYTPFLICALGAAAWSRLAVIWGIALAGIAVKVVWMNAPRWLSTAFYLALGWCIVAIPEALARMPLSVLVLTALGGVAYSAGAVIYATKKPNLSAVWGFHEIFHLLTMLGSLLQVKPVLTFNTEGKLVVTDKCRGMKKAFAGALAKMEKYPPVEENRLIWIVHTDAEKEANELAAMIEEIKLHFE